ncbi:MAG: DUF551 domain-containing protein [Methylobacterium sp.]|nr:DUF551 domain-containing protein [Methylobacterium sp.]
MTDWKSIETAPKDGFFLAYTPQFGGHCVVWMADLYWLGTDRGTPDHLSSKGFTHWMPLPKPPIPAAARPLARRLGG